MKVVTVRRDVVANFGWTRERSFPCEDIVRTLIGDGAKEGNEVQCSWSTCGSSW